MGRLCLDRCNERPPRVHLGRKSVPCLWVVRNGAMSTCGPGVALRFPHRRTHNRHRLGSIFVRGRLFLVLKSKAFLGDMGGKRAQVVLSQEVGASQYVQDSCQCLLESAKSSLLGWQSWLQATALRKVGSASLRNLVRGKGKQTLGLDILREKIWA